MRADVPGAWTVMDILKWTAGYFKSKGIERGRLDAELLLADTLGLDRVGLYLHFDRPLEERELDAFRARVSRRGKREPLQYILGQTEFWSLPFRVAPGVLIPRPETELLVEESLKRIAGPVHILDAGTGSGILAVTLAREMPESRVDAIDLSREAVALAAENAARNGVSERIRIDICDFQRLAGGPYDLIVSNPPYIAEGDLPTLMPEVGQFEPKLALDGGRDGLDSCRELIRQSPEKLCPGGWLLLEIGVGQADSVRELMEEAGLREVFVRDDYAGIPRVVGGRKMEDDHGEFLHPKG